MSTKASVQPRRDLGALLRPRRGIFDYGVVLGLLLVFVVLSVVSSGFLTKTNLLNILQANAGVGIAACAGTLVIVGGGVDLSVGAIFAVSGVIAAKLAISAGAGIGIGVGIASGAGLGLLNGLVITVGGVNPLIATIAAAIMIGGGADVLAGQALITPKSPTFLAIGNDSALGIQYSIWIFVLAAVIFGFALSRARLGRELRVVGANEEAARLSAVTIGRVRCASYILSGLAAAVAAVLFVSQGGAAQSSIGGTPFVLSVIAAIAVGGTSLRGGEGAIWRTLVGVLFLGLVTNGLALLNVNPLYNNLFTGLLILIAVGSEAVGRRRT